MKRLLEKIIFIKDVIGLISILFYFCYVGFSMVINKGNNLINVLLLIITIIYSVVYILTTFTFENKKVRKIGSKVFKRSKKFIGFVNTLLIVISVIATTCQSFFTIIFSIISIMGYIIYVLIDIFVSSLKRKIKRMIKKHDNRR